MDLQNDTIGAQRGARGGDYVIANRPNDMLSIFRNKGFPTANPINVGFRIASVVPEPNGLILTLLAVFLGLRSTLKNKAPLRVIGA